MSVRKRFLLLLGLIKLSIQLKNFHHFDYSRMNGCDFRWILDDLPIEIDIHLYNKYVSVRIVIMQGIITFMRLEMILYEPFG